MFSAAAWNGRRADDDVHALVAIALPTGATGDLTAAITAADTRGRPVVAVLLTQPESVRMLPGTGDRPIPAYGTPEIAVRALARAAGYGAWRAEPRGHVPEFPDIETAEARALIRSALEHGAARGPSARQEPGARPGTRAGSAPSRPPACSAATGCRWPTCPRRVPS